MPEFDENSGEDTDELWGLWDGQCQACDCLGRVNDLLLCEDCAAMLDRDLIRQRDWAYSAMAFGVPPEHREELRRQIIAQFGEEIELIAAPEETRK
ncbi:MAG: hypothetical protein KAX24_09140, partial [Anaerolineae bacterium]|nr:hypothetical protein [Anaerolineae bacterium]